MSWRINEVQRVLHAVLLIVHLYGVRFDGNPTLALEVHVVEELVLFLTVGHTLSSVQQSVRQCGLTVVNVCDDAKVADVFHKGQK